ncbi:MAG: quinone-dependent dihydroorotate dehydrogenase [Acetobacteraceae bacterium]|nr:quinone-dependent dihydroorotate dehydrogenase [Acetobacteraceae bacterium]
MLSEVASRVIPILRRLDPERAHRLALLGLRLGLAGTAAGSDDPVLAVRALGRTFRNPIGLAAGFDKNALAAQALMRLGFGFIEVGTVTPLAQPGNPRPRMFRLEQDQAVINRLGFNNAGLAALLARISRLRRDVPLGVNIGINKEGAYPDRDYPLLAAAVARYADYIAINVSSPNTPGLRALQDQTHLRRILTAVSQVPNLPPVLVKLAPDLSERELAAAVESCADVGAAGLIISNTTITRPAGLRSSRAREPGGLSGAPLFADSTAILARAFLLAKGRLTLVGCGGVFTGADALKKIEAGASLVQLYTAFAYQGPALLPRLTGELAARLRAHGYGALQEAVGACAVRLA